MDTQRDFKPFQDLMDDLSAALREGFKASDAMVRAYFDALKDVSIHEIRANVKRIIATATRDTPFPRPTSLRNRPPPSSATAPNAAQEKSERDSIRRWEELRKTNPVLWEIEVRSARSFRRMLELDEDDPGYAEVLSEYRRWDILRYAPRAEQEACVKRYLGQ
jgi:hypothetical protein